MSDRWHHGAPRIRPWEWVVVGAIVLALGVFGAWLYDFLAEVVAG